MTRPVAFNLPGPALGSVWRKPRNKYRKHSETRHVLERTLGSAVIFVSGRYSRHAHRETVSLEAWLNWQHRAKEVRRD